MPHSKPPVPHSLHPHPPQEPEEKPATKKPAARGKAAAAKKEEEKEEKPTAKGKAAAKGKAPAKAKAPAKGKAAAAKGKAADDKKVGRGGCVQWRQGGHPQRLPLIWCGVSRGGTIFKVRVPTCFCSRAWAEERRQGKRAVQQALPATRRPPLATFLGCLLMTHLTSHLPSHLQLAPKKTTATKKAAAPKKAAATSKAKAAAAPKKAAAKTVSRCRERAELLCWAVRGCGAAQLMCTPPLASFLLERCTPPARPEGHLPLLSPPRCRPLPPRSRQPRAPASAPPPSPPPRASRPPRRSERTRLSGQPVRHLDAPLGRSGSSLRPCQRPAVLLATAGWPGNDPP